jgi:hypothetical protein
MHKPEDVGMLKFVEQLHLPENVWSVVTRRVHLKHHDITSHLVCHLKTQL